MLSWLQSHKGSWNLFGHWHSGTVHKPEGNGPDDLEVAEYVQKEEVAYSKLRPTQYDCGIDGNSYKPISYNQIKKIMDGRKQIKND
jgi:calcineurin-like phosphoesterase family protein